MRLHHSEILKVPPWWIVVRKRDEGSVGRGEANVPKRVRAVRSVLADMVEILSHFPSWCRWWMDRKRVGRASRPAWYQVRDVGGRRSLAPIESM